VGDDVEVYDPTAKTKLATFRMLRQQIQKEVSEDPYLCLSDFIAPKDSGLVDHLGFMAVACFGCDEQVKKFESQTDDYNKILVQAISDRLAEGFAEALHRDIRTTHWGYANDEVMDAAGLHKVQYAGIRPAPGYPSQPDHTEKRTMWDLLSIEQQTGIALTDSFAMMPASAVCALTFAHSSSAYFGLGEINPDQVKDYALRKDIGVDVCERWLAPNLAYDVAAAPAQCTKRQKTA